MKRTSLPVRGQKLGQHFLFDRVFLQRLVDTANLTPLDTVLEIGPGLGVLTEELCKRAGKVVAGELDTSLIPRLKERIAPYSNCTIIQSDILKLDLQQLWRDQLDGKPFKLVANLPYYITTPIIMLFLESHLPLEQVTVMVQKEVADRLVSQPGGKEYGAISVTVQTYTQAERSFIVPPGAFTPPPRVQSAVLNMVIRKTPAVHFLNEACYQKTVRGCFSTRRKTLRNNVSAAFSLTGEEAERIIRLAGLDPGIRAEQCTLQQFADLSNQLYKAQTQGDLS